MTPRLFLIILIWISPVILLSDTIRLKNGKELSGKILPAEGAKILIRTPLGLERIDPSMMLSVHYDGWPFEPDPGALQLYRERSIQIAHNDVWGRYELAQFCFSASLYPEAAQELRSLLPYLTNELDEIQALMKRAEEADFKNLVARASWWGRIAHQEDKAFSILETIQSRYPDLAEKPDLKMVLSDIQKEMDGRLFQEKIKRERFLWTGPHFKVYTKNLFLSKSMAQKCEDLYAKIFSVLKISKDLAWETPVEVLIFDLWGEYAKALGTADQTIAIAKTVFELDENSMPKIRYRTILAWIPDLNQSERILSHEIVHLVLYELLGATARIPPWVSEGLALYLLNESDQVWQKGSGNPVSFMAIAQAKEYPPFERVFYKQSARMVRFLVEKGGMEKFLSLSFLLSTDVPLVKALDEVYPDDIEEIRELIRQLLASEKEQS